MINIDSLLRRNRDIDPRSIQAESDHVISVFKTVVNIDFKSNFELFHNGLHFFSFKTDYKGTPCIIKIIKKSAIDLDVAIDSITAEALSLEKLKGKGYAVQSHLETVTIKGGSDKIIGVIYRFVDGLPVDRFIRDAIEKEPPAAKKYGSSLNRVGRGLAGALSGFQ